MRVREWMTRDVHVVKPRDSAAHARHVLELHRISQLPVVVGHDLVGIVTDRDLRDAFPSVLEAAAASAGRRPKTLRPEDVPVEMVMTPNVLTVGPDDSIEEAVRRLQKERIGALPVVERGRLVGILARADVLEAFLALIERAGHPRAEGRIPENASDEIRKNW